MMRDTELTTTSGPGAGWVTHAGAKAVLEEFRHLLAVSRQEPIPWQPIPILYGEPGTGKTAICDRFIEQSRVEADRQRQTVGWPAVRVIMPFTCSGDHIHDAIHLAMRDCWRGKGEGRTTLLFVENADALLNVSRAKRNSAIDTLRVRWDRFLPVLVGSRELAQVLAVEMRFEPIPLAPIPPGPEFTTVVAGLLGTDDPVDLCRLHGETGGIIGRLLALARRGRLGRPNAGERPTRPLLPR